jgi:ribose/xylose/arabinose/galactoside ABC-type transport system permease subunit
MNKKNKFRDFIMTNGFMIAFGIMLIFFSLATNNFFSYENILTVVATASPWIVMATGLCLVVMTGSIDISIGSTLLLAVVTMNILMLGSTAASAEGSPLAIFGDTPLPIGIGIPLIFLIGILMGGVTGFLVVVLKINPLLASMGMLFVSRGIAFSLAASKVQNLPPAMQVLGSSPYFREFIIGVSLLIILIMHFIVERTKFGRQIMAIGNSPETAQRLGVKVDRIKFITHMIAGLMVCIGGTLQVFQMGNVNQMLGKGYEFTALAAIVVGGISLFGGVGKIFPGLLMGGLTLVILENGLTHLGITPYAYPFIRGGIIFIAMLADALKYKVLGKIRLVGESEDKEVKKEAI